jgi:acid phosphatase family membrane protein YuiD
MTALLVALITLVGCQLYKVGYHWIARGRLDLRWLFSAGGMPSAHAAYVVALAVFVGLRQGFGSDLFAACAVFASIVAYDAYRLRGTVERHARVLQALVAAHPDVEAEELHELVGHTLPEIAVGIVIGALVAVAAWLVVR